MYYSNYDDYMNSVLGYNRYEQDYNYDRMMNSNYSEYHDLSELYPEIYKSIYPAVCRECSRSNYRGGFSKSTIEEMVDRVYNSIDKSDFLQDELRGEIKENEKKVAISSGTGSISSTNNSNKSDLRFLENEKETRGRMNNNILRDFIKVLLIRELIGNRPNWNCRPGQNCRPPFPPPFPPRFGQ